MNGKAPHYPLQLGSRMLPTDAFFWYAEAATPQLRPLVAGLFMLDRSPDRRRFRASIERLVARVPRLRQRVTDARVPFGLPCWEDDPGFDLDYHLRSLLLPAPASKQHLFDFTGAVFAAPLDHLRPLWEGHLIEGLEGGRAALFLKLHHSVMDGLGSMGLFDAMTQADRADPVRSVPRRRVDAAAPSNGPVGALAALRDSATRAAEMIGGAGRVFAEAWRDPRATIEQVTRAAQDLRNLLAGFGPSATSDPLAASCTGIGRRLDGVTLSLPRMRAIKDALGITLNDLALTAVSGAVGRYLASRGIRLNEVTCLVPTNLRTAHERYMLGNRVGGFHVRLPVRERDPLARLERIHRQTGVAKGNSRQGPGHQALMRAVGLVPAMAFRALARNATGRLHLICSNVPGPTTQRYLGGARVDAVYAFAPIMLGTPLSIALLSYGDTYAVGIDTDPSAIPDPERLREYLEEEINEIEHRALRLRPGPRVSARVARNG